MQRAALLVQTAHVANMSLLRKRASVKAPDASERALHLEVAERFAGTALPPYLIAVEWPSIKNGRGDLVFSCEDGAVVTVVEAKYIKEGSSDTTKTARRRKVLSQAHRYMRDWKVMHPKQHVVAAIYTNLDGLDFIDQCLI